MKNIILFLFLSLALFANIPTQEVAVQELVKVEVKPFVKVSDVPQRVVKTLVELKKIKEAIKEEKKVTEMQSLVKPYSDSLTKFLNSSDYKNLKIKNVRDLQKMQSEIAIYLKQLEEWAVVLKSRIKIYDENSNFLDDYSSLWSQTHINAVNETAPEAILSHIASVIVSIEEISNDLKVKYDTALVNSQIISTNILNLREMDSALSKQEVIIQNKIFFQNEPPLFEIILTEEFSFLNFIAGVDDMALEKYNESFAYVESNPELQLNFLIAIFLIVSFITYFYFLYTKKRLFVKAESFEKKDFKFLSKPIATFFILSILAATAIFTDRPKSFVEIELLLLILPIIRVLWVTVDDELKNKIPIFFLLYAIYLIDKNSIGYEFESRVIMLIINIALFAYIATLFKNNIVRFITYPFMKKLGSFILGLYLLALFIAISSDIYGSVLLGNRITNGVFITFYASIIFYTMYLILTGYVVILLRRRMSSASNMLDLYAQKIEKTIKALIKIWMFSWWLIIVAKIAGAYPFLITFRDDFLALSWKISDITISIQSIFDFSIIVVATWLIARVTKTILEIEIFSRFTLPRGMPTAILTTLNYLIVISGTIIAFSSLGVSAQQFALIFGALGVGIGFGLRNIIANFVSGIIMVFERPVQIGDTIEMDKTMGNVQSIGARSSVIKTFDGSEVIIPNADFIAKEITNWTLSNEHRRKTLEFKVALGSDIDEVLEIMKDVTLNHPDVLKEPEPLATFKGFDEYYLRFKLYYWLADNLIVAQSDIAIEVYRRLQKSGVDMPIPQVQHKGQEQRV